MPKDKKGLAAKYAQALKKIEGDDDGARGRKRGGGAQKPRSKVNKKTITLASSPFLWSFLFLGCLVVAIIRLHVPFDRFTLGH
jgi:hypothetical protein